MNRGSDAPGPYLIQRAEFGTVLLDSEDRILALSPGACRLLGQSDPLPIGQNVLELHPDDTRARVRAVLDAARAGDSVAARSMTVTVPGRTLVIKAEAFIAESPPLGKERPTIALSIMDTSVLAELSATEGPKPNRLVKIPIQTQKEFVLLDPAEALFFRSDGHYSTVRTLEDEHFCSLSLKELETRLDAARYFRIHRAYIVNLDRALAVRRTTKGTVLVMDAPVETSLPIARNRIARLREILAI